MHALNSAISLGLHDSKCNYMCETYQKDDLTSMDWKGSPCETSTTGQTWHGLEGKAISSHHLMTLATGFDRSYSFLHLLHLVI